MAVYQAASPSLTGELLASQSPIRNLLSNATQIGAVYRLDGFAEALTITNDEFVRKANGVPMHAFLVAATADLVDPDRSQNVPADDEEVVLLRVIGNAHLPQENDLEFLRAQAGIDLVIEDGRAAPRARDVMVDPLTEVRMQTAGLRCAVLGTFYDEDTPDGPRLAFGSDIDNVYAAARLRVFKPFGASLEHVVGFMASSQAAEARRLFHFGNVRYASTRRRERLADASGQPTNVPVKIDIADLIAHKTAVLGMTRKGKSNSNKVIATMTHQYANERDLKIGQLIFDPHGEYGNFNEQDKTSLAEIGDENVIRYRLGATEAELRDEVGLRSLALNFFDQDSVSVMWGLVGDFLTRNRPGVDYVRAFAAADIEGPANPQTSDDYRLVSYARRARMMVYACFLKAGLKPPSDWTMWVPLKKDVRFALAEAGGRNGEDLSFLENAPKSKRGDQVGLRAQQLLLVAEALASHGTASNPNKHLEDWIQSPNDHVLSVANVLIERKGSGYKILLPLREGYHAPNASKDYAPAVYRDLVDGKIVIVDLARGSEGILQFVSERILNLLLARASERFRSGQPPELIQIFLEEAQRLFNRDKFKDRLAEQDPYVRLAREAGKYKIGMIYSTQQVSSVDPDVLDNTANWIVAHINSQAEVKLLEGRYEFDRFAEQILRAEDVGFVRMKTQSSRFVIPVQVRLFDKEMIEAARSATSGSGQKVEA